MTAPTGSALPRRGRRSGLALAAVGLALGTFALYLPASQFGFLSYDDRALLSPSSLGRQPLSPGWVLQGLASGSYIHWVPATWLSYNLDFALWGERGGMLHLTNAAIHAASAALLFLALAAYTGLGRRSAAVAALFASHPLRVEAVAWISSRHDLLMGLFFQLTLIFWLRYLRRPSAGRYGTALAFFGFGLLSKGQLAFLPLLLLVLDFWPLARGRSVPRTRLLAEKVPFLLLALLSGLLAARAIIPLGPTLAQLPFRFRLMNAATSLLWYLGKTVWPTDLAVFYPHPGWSQSAAAAAVRIIALGAATVVFLHIRRRFPYLAAGWLWYLLALLPVLGFVQLGSYARSDRYSYLPQIGVLVALVWLAAGLSSRLSRARAAPLVTVAAATLALAAATTRQIGFWRDDLTLFSHALAVTQRNFVARINLGLALKREGRREEALREFREAVRVSEGHPEAYEELGNALVEENRPAEAVEAYRAALKATPVNPGTAFRLGSLLETLGKPAEAAEAYRTALGVTRADRWGGSGRETGGSEAANGLGRCLALLGRIPEARASFARAVEIDPENLGARVNLARTLLLEKQPEQAGRELREVLRRDPGNAPAQELLAQVN